MSRADAFVPLAVTTRSDHEESMHFGAVVGLDRDGNIACGAGDPNVEIYGRSANKPIQARAMVELGLVLPPELLALVCASHDGAPTHLEGVRRILAQHGLDETALQNTSDLPLDNTAAEAVLRGGGSRTSLQMNCSGKHAGMVATCVVNGWAPESYLDPLHPLQQAITVAFPALNGDQVAHIGVDGCGAPAHVTTLIGLARAFRTIAIGAAGASGDRVRSAMTAHPEMVGGQRRDVTLFMRHVPELMAKDGAEGVFAAALPDGRAVALKVADGSNRARPVAMVEALRAVGVDVSDVEGRVRQRVLGHGREVGHVAVVADLGGGRG